MEKSADAVLADLIENGVGEDELNRARNEMIAQFIYDQDSQFNQARLYGWALVTGHTIEDVQKRAERLEAVTPEDVQAAARKFFDPKRSVTGELLAVDKALAAGRPVSIPGPAGTIH
jgi:zinc protease